MLSSIAALQQDLNQSDLKALLLDIVQTRVQYSFSRSQQVLSRQYVKCQFTCQSIARGTESLHFA